MSKPSFHPKYLNKFDPICRKLARHIFAPYGLRVVDGVKFDIDQIVYHGDDIYGYLEVEYAEHQRFVGPDYISPNESGVSIPQRKQRMLVGRRAWWMNFSYDLTHYIIIPGAVILKEADLRFYKPYNNKIAEWFYLLSFEHPATKIWPISEEVINQAALLP